MVLWPMLNCAQEKRAILAVAEDLIIGRSPCRLCNPVFQKRSLGPCACFRVPLLRHGRSWNRSSPCPALAPRVTIKDAAARQMARRSGGSFRSPAGVRGFFTTPSPRAQLCRRCLRGSREKNTHLVGRAGRLSKPTIRDRSSGHPYCDGSASPGTESVSRRGPVVPCQMRQVGWNSALMPSNAFPFVRLPPCEIKKHCAPPGVQIMSRFDC